VGLDADSIHEIAVKNLDRVLSNRIAIQDLTLYKAIVTGDHLEASTLLMPNLWEKLASECAGELLMVVPTHNIVFCTGSMREIQVGNTSVTPSQVLGLMCTVARTEQANEQVHCLSEYVFKWIGGWQVHGSLGQPAQP
jgi:hypothetical protein